MLPQDKPCERCNGEGVIEKNFPATETRLEFDAPVECPECDGTGVDHSLTED